MRRMIRDILVRLFSTLAAVSSANAIAQPADLKGLTFVPAPGVALKAYPIVSPATIVATPQTPSPEQSILLDVNTGIVCFPGGDPEAGVFVSINGAVIDITVFTSICVGTGTPPPPFHFTVDVGPLPSGIYTLNLSYRNRPSQPPEGPIPPFDPPVQLLTQPLVVASAAAIPTVGTFSLALLFLSLSIAGLGFARARQK